MKYVHHIIEIYPNKEKIFVLVSMKVCLFANLWKKCLCLCFAFGFDFCFGSCVVM